MSAFSCQRHKLSNTSNTFNTFNTSNTFKTFKTFNSICCVRISGQSFYPVHAMTPCSFIIFRASPQTLKNVRKSIADMQER